MGASTASVSRVAVSSALRFAEEWLLVTCDEEHALLPKAAACASSSADATAADCATAGTSTPTRNVARRPKLASGSATI